MSRDEANMPHQATLSRSLMGLAAIAATLVVATAVVKPLFHRKDPSTLQVARNTADRYSVHTSPVLRDNGSQNAAASETVDQAKPGSVKRLAATNQRDQTSKHTVIGAAITDDLPLLLVPTGLALSSIGSQSPQAQNQFADLALANWRKRRQLADAVAAFYAAKLASSADPQLIEARYNLASALEAMSISLRDDAHKRWEEYLTVDSTSDRARDVRRYLDDEKGSKQSSELISRVQHFLEIHTR
jgi:hypothetical protein